MSDFIVLDQYHLFIYSLCICSVLLLVWLLFQIIRHPEQLIRALNENQRLDHQVAGNVDSGILFNQSVPFWKMQQGQLQSQNVPCSHTLTHINGSPRIQIENISTIAVENTESNACPLSSLVGFNVPISVVKRFLDNSSSPHAKDLFTPYIISDTVTHSESIQVNIREQKDVHIDCSSSYPLVVLSLSEHSSRVRGLLSVFHVKHASNSRTSSLLFQFLVCEDGWYPLKKLFVSHDCCVVCQVQKSEVCLLPCGHKCTCKDCSFMIKLKCPVCRAPVSNTIIHEDSHTISV